MNNERKKKLLETLKGFNKNHKSEIFTLGTEIKELEVIPSGVPSIDNFIGGGFKRGGHTIIWGTYSVGKTALVLTTLANAQKDGKLVCYVNTEKPIEPERFKFFGINLDDLVYVEAPENAEQALEAMRTLCREKVIDLFIIDSTNGLCPKSVQEEKGGKERSLEKKNVASLPLTLSNFYNAVNALVFKSRASIIWIGQGRVQGIGTFFTRLGLSGGNAQEFYAYQIIFMRRGTNSDSPMKKVKEYTIENGKLKYKTVSEPSGFDVVMKLEKTNSCKSAKEKSEIHIPFYYETGFHTPKESEEEVRIDSELIDLEKEKVKEMLIEKGILKKTYEQIKISNSPVIIVSKQEEKIINDAVEEHLKEKSKNFQEEVKKGTKKLKEKFQKNQKEHPGLPSPANPNVEIKYVDSNGKELEESKDYELSNNETIIMEKTKKEDIVNPLKKKRGRPKKGDK